MSREKRILVAGATGYLGGYVARGALDKGYRVLALARDRAKAEALEAQGAEILVADACDRSSLCGRFEAVDVLVSSIGLRSMKASPSFEEVDFRANMNLLEEALAAGVGHFIFVSVLKGEQLRASIPLFDARERVVDALKVSGMNYTVVRPNGFFNDMAAMFAMAKQGRFVILGKGDTRINPIHGKDLARSILDSVEDESRWFSEYDIGGPETFTLKEIGELSYECLGRKPQYYYLPTSLLSFSATVCAPFNKNAASILRAMAQMGNARDMLAPRYGEESLRDFFKKLAAC